MNRIIFSGARILGGPFIIIGFLQCCFLLIVGTSLTFAQTAPTGPPTMPTISGPSAVTQPAGTTNYTASASTTTGTSYQWSLSNSAAGTITGNTTTGALQWTSTFSGNVQVQCIAYNSYGASATASYAVTSTIPSLVASVISPSSQSINSGTSTTLTGTASTGGSGSYAYQWQSSAAVNGTYTNINNANGLSYTTGSLAATTYFKLITTSNSATATSNTATVTVYPQLTGGTITPATLTINSGTAPGTLTGSLPTGGNGTYTYQWQKSTDGSTWTNLSSTAQNYAPGTMTASAYFQRKVVSNGVTAQSTDTYIIVDPALQQGTISPASQTISYNSAPLNITGNGGSGGSGSYVYQWQSSPDNSTWTNITQATSTIFNPGAVLASTYYRLGVTSNNSTFYTNSAYITVTATGCVTLNSNPGSTTNYIINDEVSIPGIKSITDAQVAAMSTCQIKQEINYFDGLGRQIQTVTVKGSPLGNDLVQPMAYDAFGREATKYLPYAVSSSTTSDGSYKTNALSSGAGVFAFYNPTGSGPSGVGQQTNGIPVTADPIAVTGYEPSPLDRIVEKSVPGEAYQFIGPGSSSSSFHTQKLVYTTNNQTAFNSTLLSNNSGSQQVALYTATINSDQSRTLNRTNNNAYYDNGQLYVTISMNENWQPGNGCLGTTEEYKDKQGETVLKRTYYLTTVGTMAMLSTYYVYDNLGNLCFVLPPGANPDANAAITQATLDAYCYQYRYDARNRLSQKQLPGTGWDFTVYNTLDQVVMTQTPNQRSMTTQQWTFTKYDGMGRALITGIYSYSGAGADVSLDNPNQSYFQNLSTTYAGITTNVWEVPLNTTATGYNGLSYPTGQSFTFYKINFYDNYTAIPSLPPTYDQHTSTAYSTMLTGLPTASKTYVLNTTQALWTVDYYNDLGETIRTLKQHYLGGSSALSVYNYDDISTVYNFAKQPLAVTRSHYESNGGTSATLALTVADNYAYDPQGRKINSYQQLTNHANTPQAQVLVAQNVYNEVGQLMKKNLYAVSPFTSFLQSVNYRYNPRGWLSYINNASLSSDGGLTSNETTDQFGEELYYDNTNTGIPQYNGNISSIKWKSGNTTAGTQSQLGYDYRYDALNRLTAGVSLTAGTKNHFYDEYAAYDNMGNITSLGRYDQVTTGTPTQIDTLAYTYSSNNQLLKIIDNSAYTGAFGFVPRANAATQTFHYTWDLNGNETKDYNKSINSSGYNLLNLPATVTFVNGNTVVYIYDADGSKLRKVSTAGSVASTTEYIDGVEYDPNGTSTPTITFLETEEGRARWNATTGTYIYEYDLKDHLGNTRVTFNNSGSGGALQILQENNYYPFGASIGSLYPLAPSPQNYYLYNHKELQPETGLYDYGARFYDPLLGRWTSVDPLAEKDRRWSPYNYGVDNSIRFIDPDGMGVKDNYKLLKNGKIELVAKTDDKKDKLFATNSKGEIKSNKSITLQKGILQNSKSGHIVAAGKEYNFNIYKINDSKEATNFFHFAANNSNVEWGIDQFSDGSNFVSTSQWHTAELGSSALFTNETFDITEKKLIESDHSHPSGIHYPSGIGDPSEKGSGDMANGRELEERYHDNKIKFNIYTPSDGETTPYNPQDNGPIQLNEVDIKSGGN